MGFFSCIGRAISSGISAVTTTVKKVAKAAVDISKKMIDKGKKIVKSVAEKTSNMWNGFTGKDKYDEANALYDKLSCCYNEEKTIFDRESKISIDAIEVNIIKINDYKKMIFTNLFSEMVEKLSKIKDVEIPSEFLQEKYRTEGLRVDKIKKRDELFSIDFDKNKFKVYTLAIFTLGFFTRKKAKETLLRVKDEELKINAEIEKMKAELKKLKAIEMSLSNAVEYFESMVQVYSQLLTRLDNTMNTFYMKSMIFTHKLASKNFSLKMLPVVSIKEIQALITASKVLKKIGETNFSSVEVEKVKVFSKETMKSKEILENTLKVA